MATGDSVVDDSSNVGAKISIPALGGMQNEEKSPIENYPPTLTPADLTPTTNSM